MYYLVVHIIRIEDMAYAFPLPWFPFVDGETLDHGGGTHSPLTHVGDKLVAHAGVHPLETGIEYAGLITLRQGVQIPFVSFYLIRVVRIHVV